MFNKKNFKAYIPQHPFRHHERGEHDAFYCWKDDAGLESALKEYGAIRDPLTDAERQTLIEAFGTLKPGEIRQHLANDFTPAQIETLTWDNVVSHAQNKIKVGQTFYTLPLSLQQWAHIFDVHRNTIRKWAHEGRHGFQQVSDRKWRLPKTELPSDLTEKYKDHIYKDKKK